MTCLYIVRLGSYTFDTHIRNLVTSSQSIQKIVSDGLDTSVLISARSGEFRGFY